MTLVVVVDESDTELGTAEKLHAHRSPAVLHRAFSAFLLGADGRIVLQRRSHAKYHFGGLWANSCCGHPLPGESVLAAVARRSQDELGVSTIGLRTVASVVYTAYDPQSGLMEREFDHVVVGQLSGQLVPDPAEVAQVRFVTVLELADELHRVPEQFTPWVAPVLNAWMAAPSNRRRVTNPAYPVAVAARGRSRASATTTR